MFFSSNVWASSITWAKIILLMSMRWKDFGSNTAKDVGNNPIEVYTFSQVYQLSLKDLICFFFNQRFHWEFKKTTLLLNTLWSPKTSKKKNENLISKPFNQISYWTVVALINSLRLSVVLHFYLQNENANIIQGLIKTKFVTITK